jgi:hypothetical protein
MSADMHLKLLPVLVTRYFFLWPALSIDRAQALSSICLLSCWTRPVLGRLERGIWTVDRVLNLLLDHHFLWFENWFRWAVAGKRASFQHARKINAGYKGTGRSDPYLSLKSPPMSFSKVFNTL